MCGEALECALAAALAGVAGTLMCGEPGTPDAATLGVSGAYGPPTLDVPRIPAAILGDAGAPCMGDPAMPGKAPLSDPAGTYDGADGALECTLGARLAGVSGVSEGPYDMPMACCDAACGESPYDIAGDAAYDGPCEAACDDPCGGVWDRAFDGVPDRMLLCSAL